MKLANRLYLCLLFFGNFTFSQSWVKTDITDFASIQFPIASELTETEMETVFSASDATAVYIVSIRKLTSQQSAQITKDEVPNLYQGVARGAVEAARGEIVSMNEITIDEIPGLELEYQTDANHELPGQRFKRIIYVNRNIISIDFWPLAEQSDLLIENKTKFFNSVSINADETESIGESINADNTETSTAYETGFLLGQILFYVLLIAVLLGLFLLVRYLIKKNDKKYTLDASVEQPKVTSIKISCGRCDTENNSDSKYCKGCGYELPKS